MQRSSLVIRVLIGILPWFSLAIVIAILTLAINGVVAHDAGALTTQPTFSQHEERESFMEKRCAPEDIRERAACTSTTSRVTP
jgi:hypothetical protein